MAESQDIDGFDGRVVMIEGDVAGIPERDDQFALGRRFRKRAAHVGRRFQQEKLSFDCLSGPPRGLRALRHQELPAAAEARGRGFGDN
jgi:hypothetical protein